MKIPKLSLAIFTNCLEERGFKIKFYFDRVKLYVDSTIRDKSLRNLPAIGEQIIEPRALLHYENMNRIIDAHQPNIQYFEELKVALTGDYLVNYVEFAMDIISDNKMKVSKLRQLLNELWVYERKHSKQRYYHGIATENGNATHYFGNRNSHKDILVIYSDKDSKAAKKKGCVHIEMRFSGSKVLKDLGIYTVQDLIDFDHEKLWNRLIDLRDAHYAELGRLILDEKPNSSDSSHRRHGQQFLKNFVGLQELLMENPDFAKVFPAIKDRRMFESRLNEAFR